MSDGEIVFVSVMIAAGVGCLVVAAVMWWNRVKAKYDPVFVVKGPIPNDDTALNQGRIDVNEAALRRMMKETSAEMEETGEWWGYRWSK